MTLWSRDSDHLYFTDGATQAQRGSHCPRSCSCRRVEVAGILLWVSESTHFILSCCIMPPCNVTCLVWAWSTEMKPQDPGECWKKAWCLGEEERGPILKWWLEAHWEDTKLATGFGAGSWTHSSDLCLFKAIMNGHWNPFKSMFSSGLFMVWKCIKWSASFLRVFMPKSEASV